VTNFGQCFIFFFAYIKTNTIFYYLVIATKRICYEFYIANADDLVLTLHPFRLINKKLALAISNILGVRIHMKSLFFVNSKVSRGSFPTSADPWLKFLVGIPEDLKFQLKDLYGLIFIIILHFSNFSIDLLISLCYFII